MRKTLGAALAAMLLLVSACGGEPEAVVRDDEATQANDRDTPIADDLRKPIDKAAAVEDAARARKAEMDRRLAEMEGETEDDDDGDP